MAGATGSTSQYSLWCRNEYVYWGTEVDLPDLSNNHEDQSLALQESHQILDDGLEEMSVTVEASIDPIEEKKEEATYAVAIYLYWLRDAQLVWRFI